MEFLPGNLYHVYNQGNNKQVIFYKEDDYFTFLRLAKKYFLQNTETIAWCLMPNHFHFMIYADERCLQFKKQGGISIDPLTNGIRELLSSYARTFNSRYNRAGSVFRQKTKTKCISDILFHKKETQKPVAEEYYANCFHYIHQNPLRAGLVSKLEDWPYSSYRDFAGLRQGILCNKELTSKLCLYNPETFIEISRKLVSTEIINLR